MRANYKLLPERGAHFLEEVLFRPAFAGLRRGKSGIISGRGDFFGSLIDGGTGLIHGLLQIGDFFCQNRVVFDFIKGVPGSFFKIIEQFFALFGVHEKVGAGGTGDESQEEAGGKAASITMTWTIAICHIISFSGRVI